ncbi:MAG: hypothetical protein NXI22_10795 [bacterium]|nr:hypothetical protein [bacterium]
MLSSQSDHPYSVGDSHNLPGPLSASRSPLIEAELPSTQNVGCCREEVRPMFSSLFARFSFACLMLGAIALTGCPNAIQPTGSGGSEADQQDALEWVKKVDAVVTEKDGHVVAIDFSLKSFENKDLEKLSGLPKLATLTFLGPDVNDETLVALAEVKSLRALRLDGTQVGDDGIKAIASLPELEELRLDKTALTDEGFAAIATFPKIKRIFCSRTKISDEGLKHFKGKESLEAIDLTQCISVTDAGIVYLADCPRLKYLKMYGRDVITDDAMEAIKGLTNMKVLGIDDTGISDAGLVHIENFDQLQEFYAFRCPDITNDGVAHLTPLTNLKRIRLRATSINSGCAEHLIGLPQLAILDLSETYVGDDGLAELKKITSLKDLNLWHTDITDAGLEHVAEMTQLTSLNLDDNQVGDAGIEQLSPLVNLTFLHLGKTNVSDSSVETIKNFTKLKTLDVSNAFSLSTDAVEEIQAALPDCKIIGP